MFTNGFVQSRDVGGSSRRSNTEQKVKHVAKVCEKHSSTMFVSDLPFLLYISKQAYISNK